MNKELKKITPNIILIFLYLQPFLDLSAGLLLNNGFNNYISSIIRLIFMTYLIFYLIFTKYDNKKRVIFYLISLLIYLVIYSLINNSNLLYEYKNTFIFVYFSILLVSFKVIYKDTNIDKRHLINILIIYTLLTFIPNLFNIGFNSYLNNDLKLGKSGFFYSANTLGLILLLLFMYVYNDLKKMKIIPRIIFYIIYIYTILSIGTKTPIVGIAILLLFNLIYYLIKSYSNKIKFISIIVISSILVIFSALLFSKTNMYHNLNTYFEYLDKENIKIGSLEYIDHIVFGLRIRCEEENRKLFNDSSVLHKLFGIGYDTEPRKLSEMDYFDTLYRNGIIGFIIIYLPLLLISFCYIKNIEFSYLGINKLLILFLILILALIEGHVFSTTTVSIFASLILALNQKSKK